MGRPRNPNVPEDGFISRRQFLETGSIAKSDFAVVADQDNTKKMVFDPTLQDPNTTMTLRSPHITSDVTITLPSVSGTLMVSSGGMGFGIVQPITGTSPTATIPDDILTTTSSDSSIGIAGNSSTNTLTFSVLSVGGSSAANVHTAELAANAATSSNTASTIVKRDGSGNFTAGTITANLTGNASGTAANVTGVVVIANGGTNSSTALNNNRVIKSSGGAIVEAAAIAAAKALISDANGIPVASSVTSTELGYVSGVTSAIQTQLDSKLNLSGGTLTGNLILNGNPSTSNQAANKAYVDSVAQGLSVKTAVTQATTANITLSGEQTIDGVLTSATRILVKNQSTATQNGIYTTAAGAWSRTADYAVGVDEAGTFMFVELGTLNNNTGWVQTADPGVVGTNNLVFTQFSGAGTYTADGLGVKLTGTQFSFSIDGTTLSQGSSGAKVATGGITNTEVNASAAIAYSKLSLSNSIVNADINSAAAIVDTKLATISTASKVSNSATTAASANTASAIVARDGSGNFTAGTITAALTGTASGNTTYTANNHGVVVSGSGNAMTVIAPNASTAFPLVSGGSSADPAWSALTIAGGGTGNTTQAYTTLTDGATITWTVAGIVNNATVTLGGNRTLAFSGSATGMTGTLIVKQDGTGSRTLTLPSGSKVIGGGSGAVTLTTTASAIDVLAFTYDGTNYLWTIGKNYT